MTLKSLKKQFLTLFALTFACLTLTGPAQAQVRWQDNARCTFSGVNCQVQYTVPMGQRLTVEYISSTCEAPSGAVDEVYVGATFNGSGSWWQGVALNIANGGATVSSNLVNIYGDQSTMFSVLIERLTGTATNYACNVLITGHLDTNLTQ